MVRSFLLDSAGGPDGLRPQQVAELIGDPVARSGLLKAKKAIVNLLLVFVCGPARSEELSLLHAKVVAAYGR